MRSSFGKALLSFLFMAAFLVPRVADLHAFSHLEEDSDQNESHCELCHITTAEDPKDLYFIDDFCYQEPLAAVPDSFIVADSYQAPLAKIASPTSVYNKPPPIL